MIKPSPPRRPPDPPQPPAWPGRAARARTKARIPITCDLVVDVQLGRQNTTTELLRAIGLQKKNQETFAVLMRDLLHFPFHFAGRGTFATVFILLRFFFLAATNRRAELVAMHRSTHRLGFQRVGDLLNRLAPETIELGIGAAFLGRFPARDAHFLAGGLDGTPSGEGLEERALDLTGHTARRGFRLVLSHERAQEPDLSLRRARHVAAGTQSLSPRVAVPFPFCIFSLSCLAVYCLLARLPVDVAAP